MIHWALRLKVEGATAFSAANSFRVGAPSGKICSRIARIVPLSIRSTPMWRNAMSSLTLLFHDRK